MAVSVLLTMGVALWYVGGQPSRAPRLLGSLGSASAAPAAAPIGASPIRSGGIGRFAKPRSGPPRRLR